MSTVKELLDKGTDSQKMYILALGVGYEPAEALHQAGVHYPALAVWRGRSEAFKELLEMADRGQLEEADADITLYWIKANRPGYLKRLHNMAMGTECRSVKVSLDALKMALALGERVSDKKREMSIMEKYVLGEEKPRETVVTRKVSIEE